MPNDTSSPNRRAYQPPRLILPSAQSLAPEGGKTYDLAFEYTNAGLGREYGPS